MIPLLLLFATQDCTPCHREIAASYAKSPMARTSGKVVSLPPASFTHKVSRTTYRVEARQVSITTPLQAATQSLEYFIGSGAHGQSFLINRAGKLYEAPITHYKDKGWAMSPGYENDDRSDWTRPIDRNCLWCHASGTRHIFGTVNQYADPPFANAGITCDRCHAPTPKHHSNPVKLEAQARNDTCRQCHLLGESRIDKPGHSFFEYQPGMRLDTLVSYRPQAQQPSTDLKVTGHFERLAMSKCQIASGDKLWCGTCHNPHPTKTVDVNAPCLKCHGTESCQRGPDCQSCHMPKAPAPEASHAIFTDHWIRIVESQKP